MIGFAEVKHIKVSVSCLEWQQFLCTEWARLILSPKHNPSCVISPTAMLLTANRW